MILEAQVRISRMIGDGSKAAALSEEEARKPKSLQLRREATSIHFTFRYAEDQGKQIKYFYLLVTYNGDDNC